jgi:RNA polymerase sigma factor (sigma-70 family)
LGDAQTDWGKAHVSSESEFPALLAAAREGAEWAWTRIYREYSRPVLRYLRARGAQEPEDLLGEVFVQVVRNLPTFAGTESEFRSWVFMIARNRLVDERRKARRTPVELVGDRAIEESAGTGHAEDDAMRRIADARVMATLNGLTTDQRDVLFLRLFARLTVEEVAQVIGKRPGAVKALQSRALATIRREMSR